MVGGWNSGLLPSVVPSRQAVPLVGGCLLVFLCHFGFLWFLELNPRPCACQARQVLLDHYPQPRPWHDSSVELTLRTERLSLVRMLLHSSTLHSGPQRGVRMFPSRPLVLYTQGSNESFDQEVSLCLLSLTLF